MSQKVKDLEVSKDRLSSQLLIQEQIHSEKMSGYKDIDETYKEELEELKENLERKEYLL